MRTKEEILTNIEEVMTKYVTPNVAAHGGKVNVLGFDMNTGILSTQLSGSCSGCASSAATLKMGSQRYSIDSLCKGLKVFCPCDYLTRIQFFLRNMS